MKSTEGTAVFTHGATCKIWIAAEKNNMNAHIAGDRRNIKVRSRRTFRIISHNWVEILDKKNIWQTSEVISKQSRSKDILTESGNCQDAE